MRNKESWFSVAIHPVFLIEDELEKARKRKNAPDTSSQLGLFPELESKAPAPEVAPEPVAHEPVAPEPVAASVTPEPQSPAPQSPAERAAAAQANLRQGYVRRQSAKARTEALTQPEIDPVTSAEVPAHTRTERTFGRINVSAPVVPEIHPDDKIWPTDDSPSLVDRIRDSASAAGGHLQNLKDRISRVFGSSPAAEEETKASISPSISPPIEISRQERLDAQRNLGESYREKTTLQQAAPTLTDPDPQALAQNLLNEPVGQVDAETESVGLSSSEQETTNPEITAKLREQRVIDRPLSEIRTLRDAKAHHDKIKEIIDQQGSTDERETARSNAKQHADAHEDFEDAHQSAWFHGELALTTLRANDTHHPKTSESVYTHVGRLFHTGDAMRQRIEDAGGIHEAMKDPELAKKIPVVLEAEDHMRETFPDGDHHRYDITRSDDYEGDVLERPLEGIRNYDDADGHTKDVAQVLQEAQDKRDAFNDGSPEHEAQSLIVDKAYETLERAGAHSIALHSYQHNSPENFSSHLDQLDFENMDEDDRETYRIRMNAVNTVLQQKIRAAGGKDYAQYNPRIKAFQDRIRQVAAARQAANPQAWEKARQESAATRSAKPWALAPYFGEEYMWNLDQLRDESQRGQSPNGQAPNGQASNRPAQNGQASNGQASNGQAQNLQNALLERAAAVKRTAQERKEAEEKRQAEIANQQLGQRNLRSITDNLGVKYGSPKRRR